MLICDLCRKEIRGNQMGRIHAHICTQRTVTSWKPRIFEICRDCYKELLDKRSEADVDFYKSKIGGQV